MQKVYAVQGETPSEQDKFGNLAAWGPHAESFFGGTLHASFQHRLTTAQALDHPFLAPTVAALRPSPLQL